MVAVQVPQLEPQRWSEPDGGRRDGTGVDVPSGARPVRRRALPDRATRFRRRRLLALLMATATVLGGLAVVRAFAGGTFGSGDGDPPAPPITDDVYVVQPGDSLWSIAERVAGGRDPRLVVATLREQHGDAQLQVGQRLLIDR
jgi:LysM domain